MGIYNSADIFYGTKFDKPKNTYFHHELFSSTDSKFVKRGSYLSLKGSNFNIREDYTYYCNSRDFKDIVKYVNDKDIENLKKFIEDIKKDDKHEDILYRTDPLAEWTKLECEFKWYVCVCSGSTYGPPPNYWESSESCYEITNVENGFEDAAKQIEETKEKKRQEIEKCELELKKYGIIDISKENLNKISTDLKNLLKLRSEE